MKENFRTLFTGKLREKKLYPRDVIIKGSPLMAVDMEGESRKIWIIVYELQLHLKVYFAFENNFSLRIFQTISKGFRKLFPGKIELFDDSDTEIGVGNERKVFQFSFPSLFVETPPNPSMHTCF
jgi:hypothetical protein